MNTTKGFIVGIIALICIAGFIFILNDKEEMMIDEDMQEESALDMNKEKEEMMPEEEVEAKSSTGTSMMGAYEEFTPDKLVRAETGDVVLFFQASWCPSCRGLDSDIKNNLSSIPANTSILIVDYDTELDLRKKYGVTYQHTLVQVDADGEIIKKWSGSPTLARLVAELY